MKVSLPHDHFRYLPAVLIAAAVGALVMAPAFVADAYPAFGDNITFWAPSTAFWKAQVQDGAYPLWNPYVLGGIPFAADINHGLLYPPHWIAFFLDAPVALSVLLAAHIALAALGAIHWPLTSMVISGRVIDSAAVRVMNGSWAM